MSKVQIFSGIGEDLD